MGRTKTEAKKGAETGEIIYSSCQKIFLKCCLPIFPDWFEIRKKYILMQEI
jgi:hypothetical protein